jgi:hypothetical protein
MSEITNSTGSGQPHHHLLQAEVSRGRCQPPGQGLGDFRVQVDGWRHEDGDPVPVQSPLGVPQAKDGAQGAGRLVEGVLEGRNVEGRLATVVGRAAAGIGQHEDPLVRRYLPTAAVEAVDVLGGRDALELEAVEPVQVDPACRLRVDAVVGLHRAKARRRNGVSAVQALPFRRHRGHGEPARGLAAGHQRLQRPQQRVDLGLVLDRDEELDRFDRGPVARVELARGDPEQTLGAAHQLGRCAGGSQHGAPAGELEAVEPALSTQGGEVT